MMRSLYSGVSGLKTHQIKMDVIGNNIANVNTVAYKYSTATFQNLFYQTTQSATGPSATLGGKNAKQIGLGVTMGAIKSNIGAQGATQNTGDSLDMMINGDGFFVVNNGVSNYFTRAGAFYVDGAGNLAMTTTGYNLMGWKIDPNTQEVIKDTVSKLQVMGPENQTFPAEATSKAIASGIMDELDPGLNSDAGQVMTLKLIDSLGYEYTAKFSIQKLMDNSTPPVYQKGKFLATLSDVVDSKGTSLGATRVDALKKDIFGTNQNSLIMSYNTGGTLDYVLPATFTAGVPGAGGGAGTPPTFPAVPIVPPTTKEVKLNFSTVTGFDTDDVFSDVDMDFSAAKYGDNEGKSSFNGTNGDAGKNGAGRKVGKMLEMSIDGAGLIYASYDNGGGKYLGQIAVANFANPSGLQKEGDNLYSTTLNSGDFDGVGQAINESGASLSTGVLEMSNVDLSQEFTDMITTQRGFQANSRVITTSDTLLDELINLKR